MSQGSFDFRDLKTEFIRINHKKPRLNEKMFLTSSEISSNVVVVVVVLVVLVVVAVVAAVFVRASPLKALL